MRAQIGALPSEAWKRHPQGFSGNSAVPLVARNGNPADDATFGSMAPTSWLRHLPAVVDALATLDSPIGRTRLMRIDGVSEAPRHTDIDYYWQSRHRIHVPVQTSSRVIFECGDEQVHMAEGEVWLFDTTRLHRVTNPEPTTRIHLVCDSVGSRFLEHLIRSDVAGEVVPAGARTLDQLRFEARNRPIVMSPHELRGIAGELLQMFRMDALDDEWVARIEQAIDGYLRDWSAAWYQSPSPEGDRAVFDDLRQRFEQEATRTGRSPGFRELPAMDWIRRWLIDPALEPSPAAPASASFAGATTPVGPEAVAAQPASTFTDSFPALMAFLGGSLIISTYASNHLVILRARGEDLQTHFRYFPAPMGIAVGPRGLALGSNTSLWRFRDMPELAAQWQPSPDVVYVPIDQHFTGDVRVHELAWGNDGLWFVNTRFSCLASLDGSSSFVPRWFPPFATDMQAEDACHLNGLAMKDGVPAWVTALGSSGTPGGWRERKADGGVVVEVASGETVVAGLCMPHSPRWHEQRLWVLDSGRGELCVVDPQTGARDSIARVPGFARGLAMVGRYAFVGVSMVRSTAWFGDLPITDAGQTRHCGVWAVDTHNGEVIGWLQFDHGVEEIFDVQWLPGLRWPELLEADDPLAQNAFRLPD
ncbi:MAG: TIGR03032 family protein [Lysobacteraceae bacterium]